MKKCWLFNVYMCFATKRKHPLFSVKWTIQSLSKICVSFTFTNHKARLMSLVLPISLLWNLASVTYGEQMLFFLAFSLVFIVYVP